MRFAGNRVLQIFLGALHPAGRAQMFDRVDGFSLGDGLEKLCHPVQKLIFGPLAVGKIPSVCLRFAGKCIHQILFGLGHLVTPWPEKIVESKKHRRASIDATPKLAPSPLMSTAWSWRMRNRFTIEFLKISRGQLKVK